MDIKQFITEVETANWYSYNGPTYYRPKDAPSSLISLALADKESTEGKYHIEGVEADLNLNPKITNDVLFAIGNNHSGSYYPAVREALPFIVQIALFGNHVVARNCAINILIDLYYFCADCTDTDSDPIELEQFVKEAINRAVIDNRESFEKLVINDVRNKSLIEESLMGIINDKA